MLVSQCPRCDEPVRVPSRLISGNSDGDDLRIQCPWCSSSLNLSEVLSKVPPALVMVSADGSEIADSDESEIAVSGFDTQAAWGQTQGLDEAPELSFSPVQPSRPRFKADGPPEVMMDLSSPKTRRRKSSPIRQMISVVIGGVMACGLVTGVMIYAGKPLPRFGFYPFDGSFDPPAPRRSASAVSSDPPTSRSETIPVGRSLSEDLAPTTTMTDPAANAAAEIASSTQIDPVSTPNVTGKQESQPNGGAMPPSVELVQPTKKEKVVVDTTPDFTAVGIPADMKLNTIDNTLVAPAVTKEDGPLTIDEIQESFKQLPPAGDSKRGEEFKKAYQDLATLAAKSDGDSLSDLQSFLDTIKVDQVLMREFILLGSQWVALDEADRGTNGVIVVAGKVTVDGDGASLLLSGGKTVSAKLPEGYTENPIGVQIGTGTVGEEGGKTIVELKSLQPLR